MSNPSDQPAQEAEPDRGDRAVRIDVGGWISGPCLSPAQLGQVVPLPRAARAVDSRHRPER